MSPVGFLLSLGRSAAIFVIVAHSLKIERNCRPPPAEGGSRPVGMAGGSRIVLLVAERGGPVMFARYRVVG
ncbi:hypothetical protein [Bradyrhizobium cosmicum]|uniref:hypothetical protein n=1 Tax=Bradyrhizobium cosmicum TaxID=1404864 RepID=UPI0028E20BFF|nr:hypothetical protein [Bradyrhizobium cosmicum]